MVVLKKIKQCKPIAKISAFFLYLSKQYDKEELEKIAATIMEETSDCSLSYIIKDMIYCRLYFMITSQEYSLFHFVNKSEAERKNFVSHSERRKLTNLLNTTNTSWKVLKDKYQSFLTFQRYYKRDVIKINSKDDFSGFLEFLKKHDRFILKPVDATKGEGVSIIDLQKEKDSAENFFQKHLSEMPYVVEEVITQDPDLAKFHPASVNTVRIVSWYDNDTVETVFAVFRMGVGGSVVDNAGAGGIIAAVDIHTGQVISPGMREDGNRTYDVHPDTNEKIFGAFIPKWNDLLRLVDSAARSLPDQKWIGWDLALSDNGWLIVEANQSPSFVGIQMCTGLGIRNRLESTLLKYTNKIS